MRDFYQSFYELAARSPVHAEFCERVFGQNLCQHGFADMVQLCALIEALQLSPGQRVLDLGCGNGMISEFISDCTGAYVTGLDYVPEAVYQARERTRRKSERLAFVVGEISALDLPPRHYDAIISIDSIYCSDNYTRTVRQLARALGPGGKLGLLYSYGREPWVPKDQFRPETLAPECTPLAEALVANNLSFRIWDFTGDDYLLAQIRQQVLEELRPRFEAEALMFVYDNRMNESLGVAQAIEEGLHKRYLYLAQPAASIRGRN